MASRKTLYLFGGESSPNGAPAIRYSSAEVSVPLHGTNPYTSHSPSAEDNPGSSGCLSDRDSARPRNLEYRSRWEPRRALSINSRTYIDKNERDSIREASNIVERLKEESSVLNAKPKQNYFRPMGMRNNFLSGQMTSNQKNPHPPPFPHRDSGDLVAMGTYWTPLGGQASRTSLNGRPSSRGSNGGGGTASQQFPVTQNHCGPQVAPVVAQRKLGNKTVMNPVIGPRYRGKEPEPRYSDPMVNAPPGFNQRLAEVAALESDTLRWEKARKAKKKSKSDS